MQFGNVLILGSIEASKPVFWIVMGISLMMIAWRLYKKSPGWAGRITVAGAVILGLGYTILLPLLSVGQLPAAASAPAFWQIVKLVVMNGGWLVFGTGVALHSKLFHMRPPRRQPSKASSPHHESPHNPRNSCIT